MKLRARKEKQLRTPIEKKKGQIAATIQRATMDKTAAKMLEREMLAIHQRRELSSNTQNSQSIVFVHGFYDPNLVTYKGNGDGFDCQGYWQNAIDFVKNQGWQGDFRTIKYYNGDTNNHNGNDEGRLSSDLHNDLYKSNCIDFHAGPVGTDGTNDESLDHLSCLFAQYLYQNFGQSNSGVALVGHSMGGIIIRNTLARVQTDGGQGTFPTNVGQVTDAITIQSARVLYRTYK